MLNGAWAAIDCGEIGPRGRNRSIKHTVSVLAPKADICSAPTHVCFAPIADILHCTRAMSAYPSMTLLAAASSVDGTAKPSALPRVSSGRKSITYWRTCLASGWGVEV